MTFKSKMIKGVFKGALALLLCSPVVVLAVSEVSNDTVEAEEVDYERLAFFAKIQHEESQLLADKAYTYEYERLEELRAQKLEEERIELARLEEERRIEEERLEAERIAEEQWLAEQAELASIEEKEEVEVSVSEVSPEPSSSASNGSFIGYFEATAYAVGGWAVPGTVTANGTDIANTIYSPEGYRIIAVDPNVIPMNSVVRVVLPSGESFLAKASDTGGAINGNIVDILMGSVGEAMSFGRQHGLEIYWP